MAVLWCLYTAWVVFCTLPSVHTINRTCELVLSPLTMAALFLCLPAILERRHYRSIFLMFSAVLALHTLCVAWIICTKNPMFFGQQVIDRTNGHPKILGRIHLPNTDGIFISANGIGSFLALFPAILLSEFLAAPHKFKAPLAVTNAIVCLGLMLSFCRAAQASVLVGFLVPAFVFLKKTPIKRVVVCAVILLLTVLACFPDRYQWVFIKSSIGAHAAGPDALQNTTAFVVHTVTTRRTEIWMAFLKYWQAQPILGYGLLGIEYQGLGPHNFLLANLVYFGIPGLVLLVALLSLAMRQIVARMREHRELLVPIAGGLGAFMLVHGSAEYSITFSVYFANSVFWLLLGYACFTPLERESGLRRIRLRGIRLRETSLRVICICIYICSSSTGYSKTTELLCDELPNKIFRSSPRNSERSIRIGCQFLLAAPVNLTVFICTRFPSRAIVQSWVLPELVSCLSRAMAVFKTKLRAFVGSATRQLATALLGTHKFKCLKLRKSPTEVSFFPLIH